MVVCWCFCGCVFVVVFCGGVFAVVFCGGVLRWCFGGVFVVVGGVLVVVFWWCFCGGVFVVVLWLCFCGCVFVVVFSNIAQKFTEVMDVVEDCHQTFVVVFLWWCF